MRAERRRRRLGPKATRANAKGGDKDGAGARAERVKDQAKGEVRALGRGSWSTAGGKGLGQGQGPGQRASPRARPRARLKGEAKREAKGEGKGKGEAEGEAEGEAKARSEGEGEGREPRARELGEGLIKQGPRLSQCLRAECRV